MVLLLAGVAAFYFTRDRNRLEVLSQINPPVIAIPVNEINKKPAIDFDMPLVGRIRIPNYHPTPANFKAPEGLFSGILVQNATNNSEQIWSHNPPVWEINDDEIPFRRNSFIYEYPPVNTGLSVIECPVVFGNEPVIAKLICSNGPVGLDVKLPPSELVEPSPIHVATQAGPWQVRLDSLPWISPSFELRFELRIEGGKASDLLFVQIVEGEDFFGNEFQVRPGVLYPFSISNWKPDVNRTLRIWRVVKESKQVRYARIMGSQSGHYKERLFWPDGKALWGVNRTDGSGEFIDQASAGYLAVECKGDWVLGEKFRLQGEDSFNLPRPEEWKGGPMFTANCYRAIEKAEVVFRVPFPNIKKYDPSHDGS